MTRSFRSIPAVLAAAMLAFGIAACSQDATTPLQPTDSGGLQTSGKPTKPTTGTLDPASVIESTNATLASEDAPYRLSMIETITDNPDEAGITVVQLEPETILDESADEYRLLTVIMELRRVAPSTATASRS